MLRKMISSFFAVLFVFPALAMDIEPDALAFDGAESVWLVENQHVPVVTVRMAFRGAGASSDPEGKAGRAQLAASLLNEGAGARDALVFQRAVEDKAIGVRFYVDKDVLMVEMKTLAEHKEAAFSLLADALTKPHFEEKAILRMKAQMQSALLRAQEDPSYLAGRALAETLYGAHPYALPEGGTQQSIEAISGADLKAYLRNYIVRRGLLMSVVGDVSREELQDMLLRHFASLPHKAASDQKIVPQAKLHLSGQTKVLDRSQPQTVILFAGEGIARDDPDFYAAFVLNHLLGGGTLTSRLADEIREKRGLAYYAYSGLEALDHAALFMGAFGTRNEQAGDALTIWQETLRAVAAGQISEQELREAKDYLVGAFPLSLASNDGVATILLMMQRFRLGAHYLQTRNGTIQGIEMADLQRVAARLLQPEKMAVVAIGAPTANLESIRRGKKP